MAATRYPQEQMHRIKYTKLTEAQISAKLGAVAGPTSASPLSDVLAGKSLKIVTDGGLTLSYRFASASKLTVAEGDGKAVQAGYGALTLDKVAFFSHLVPGSQRGYHVIVDRDSNLATVFEVWFSGYDDKREVQRQIHYGYVEQSGKPAPAARHASRTVSRAKASTGSRTTASRRSSTTRPCSTPTSSSSRGSAASSRSAGLRTTSRSTTTSISTRASSARCPAR